MADYKLTKKQIGDAIVQYIGMYYERQLFNPYRISRTDQEICIPKDVIFTLEYSPRGEDIEHNI